MLLKHRWKTGLCALGLAAASLCARADIVVGETVGLTGSVAPSAT